MPTVITHAFVAGVAAHQFRGEERRRRLWDVGILVSVLPDADVLGFRLGVDYADAFGHRGFFHSPCCAALVALLCAAVFFRHVPRFTARWWKLVAFLSLVGASHGILDACTDGGLGIALLAPFDNTRYFAPWTPIPVSSIGLHDVFTGRFMAVLLREMLWVWLPVIAAWCVLGGIRHLLKCRRGVRSTTGS
ncbi:MAG: metal-dependent hydrolase [Phycisphaerales bacterium]|nr:metal-dependent hydrolase [Phycisphaerales bacterium]